MIKIGMMIGDRYEILEKIGTGGMSDVYKAKCHKLNRLVAIKVLKQEFSENANFVSKFRSEAQAAAGLSHPNIVNIYDVGEENGIYYIVMELIEGITLKKYIEKNARLSFKEAVSIAIQVSMGIEAAHKNHIIHRDIKPQNIIISKDGKVKVTDFGIAKAATSNTITSNVMGSVHYTSPEQARGGYSDEKSDIYSMGITLFEMLTGRVPFNGDTTVAIAIKHIQEEMPSPKEFVPEIPDSVAAIVLKCCQKSPDRRYQNMGELIADLKQSLIRPDGDFVTVNDPESKGATRAVQAQEIRQIKTNVQKNTREGQKRFDRNDTKNPEEDDYDYDPGMERITTILAIVAGVIICGIVIFLLVKVFDIFGNDAEKKPDSPIVKTESSTEESKTSESQGTDKTETVQIPQIIVGWNEGDAGERLKSLNLKVRIEYEQSDEIGENIVIRTMPEAGSEVQTGTEVVLVVSSGPEILEVPDVKGRSYEEAYTILTEAGFTVKEQQQDFAGTPGQIISQVPEGGNSLAKGGEVLVIVGRQSSASNPGQVIENGVRVPGVIGLTEEAAIAKLEEAGLVVSSVSHVSSSTVPEGKVCYQSYSQGSSVAAGTAVEIHISTGAAQ